MSCLRPSNASSRVSGPLGPVSGMLASTSTMGRRRLAAASSLPLPHVPAPQHRPGRGQHVPARHDVPMTWTAPEVAPVFGPLAAPTGDERTLADAWLDYHRQVLLWKCGGLTADQLRLRAVEPSNLSLLGLVRHMAEVERDWFRTRFCGEQAGYLYCSDDDLDAEWDVETA